MRSASIAIPAAAVAGLVALSAAPGAARADGDVQITLTPDGQQLAGELGVDTTELENRLRAKLEDLYDTANVDGFLRSFANATSFASRGTGVDYAPLFHGGEVGVTLNLSAAAEGLDASSDPAAGVAPNLSIMGGLSLAHWGHDDLVIYANGFSRSASIEGLSGTISNVGVHGQYHLFYPKDHASTLLVLWTGFHLTAGVEVSRWSFHVDKGIDRDFTLAGDNGTSSAISTHADGAFDLGATSTTIPIELTTSARLFYFAGAYLGLGVDFQAGGADTSASLTGTMQGTRPSTGEQVDVGTATITMSGSQGPSAVAFHLLGGVEANLWRLKFFVHGTVVPINGASVALGLRMRI